MRQRTEDLFVCSKSHVSKARHGAPRGKSRVLPLRQDDNTISFVRIHYEKNHTVIRILRNTAHRFHQPHPAWADHRSRLAHEAASGTAAAWASQLDHDC